MKCNTAICTVLAVSGAMALFTACRPAGGERRGHEFMPDMVHSVAYEANLYNYYYYNTWGTEVEYKAYAMPRFPVPGTIARGHTHAALSDTPEERMLAHEAFSGSRAQNAVLIHPNAAVPYAYGDTEEERERAAREIIENPYPITTQGLARGGALYVIYCGICHGNQGDGQGYLVREEDPARGITAGVYPAAPANLLLPHFADTTNGLFYHSIMHGKNLMGGYSDKLSFEERWQVIHYIRSLQAANAGLVYNENENTLNNDVPGGPLLMQIREAMGSESLPAIGSHGPPGGTDHDIGDSGNLEKRINE